MSKEIILKEIWEEIAEKLEKKQFRYGVYGHSPIYAIKVSDLDKIIGPVIRRLVKINNEKIKGLT